MTQNFGTGSAASKPPNVPPPFQSFQSDNSGGNALTRYQHATKNWPISRVFRYTIFAFFAASSLRSYLKQREFFTVKPNTVLRWRWDKLGVVEQPKELDLRSGPASLTSRTMTLYDVVQTLKDASNDDRVSGLVLDLATSGAASARSGSLGFAQAQEVREALLEFKRLKKEKFGEDAGTLVAYTDTFDSQLAYYLSSVCDEIWMEPTGMLPVYGIATAQPVRILLCRLTV